jgi:hypothetical protein
MKRKKKLLLVEILSLVVASALMGATSRKNALYATIGPRYVTIGAPDCTPSKNTTRYSNRGYFIHGDPSQTPPDSVTEAFVCAVNFPDYGVHVITQITMYAYDQHTWADKDVFAKPFLVNPKNGSETQMGTVRSTSSSTTDPRAFTISWGQISPNKVYPGQKMYFWVYMHSHNNLKFYGVKVRYNVKN